MDTSIVDKLEFLEKWILHVDSNVKFNLSMQWALIGTIVTIVGVALVIIARSWFENKLDKELLNYKNEIINEVTNFKTYSIAQNSSISSFPIRLTHYGRINAIMINCYINDEQSWINWKFEKNFLMYTKNGHNTDNIRLTFSNGATIEVKVKGLVENGFDIDWIKKGEIDNIFICLEIMVF